MEIVLTLDKEGKQNYVRLDHKAAERHKVYRESSLF